MKKSRGRYKQWVYITLFTPSTMGKHYQKRIYPKSILIFFHTFFQHSLIGKSYNIQIEAQNTPKIMRERACKEGRNGACSLYNNSYTNRIGPGKMMFFSPGTIEAIIKESLETTFQVLWPIEGRNGRPKTVIFCHGRAKLESVQWMLKRVSGKFLNSFSCLVSFMPCHISETETFQVEIILALHYPSWDKNYLWILIKNTRAELEKGVWVCANFRDSNM